MNTIASSYEVADSTGEPDPGNRTMGTGRLVGSAAVPIT